MKHLGILCAIALLNISCEDVRICRLTVTSEKARCVDENGYRVRAQSITEMREDGWLATSFEDAEKIRLEHQELRRELKACEDR